MNTIREHVFRPGTELSEYDERVIDVYSQMFPDEDDEEDLSDTLLRKEEFEPDNNYCFVLEYNGDVCVVANYAHNATDSEGEVFAIVTARTKRGMGYGALMMNYLMDKSREDGNAHLVLLSADQSVGFYEKLGFTVMDPKSMKMSKRV